MSNLAEVITPDLGKERGLSTETLALFDVRVNGAGWLWDTKTRDGKNAGRWKSFFSTKDQAPEGEQTTGKKYRWYPERPIGADYFCAPSISLTDAIKESF